ncbi:hypothetical protein BLNAU_20760 [Blattamonas nauphoetae]|uniref:Protein kinase domain-containing protein n=1 Tax=Blattamonas nauphoetae TaxID=2049346 RepID=A0ABQ9WXS3_9EUKA|nr:hypothetical protein BLNAU_20760 [Blattamonas nauphoetae]
MESDSETTQIFPHPTDDMGNGERNRTPTLHQIQPTTLANPQPTIVPLPSLSTSEPTGTAPTVVKRFVPRIKTGSHHPKLAIASPSTSHPHFQSSHLHDLSTPKYVFPPQQGSKFTTPYCPQDTSHSKLQISSPQFTPSFSSAPNTISWPHPKNTLQVPFVHPPQQIPQFHPLVILKQTSFHVTPNYTSPAISILHPVNAHNFNALRTPIDVDIQDPFRSFSAVVDQTETLLSSQQWCRFYQEVLTSIEGQDKDGRGTRADMVILAARVGMSAESVSLLSLTLQLSFAEIWPKFVKDLLRQFGNLLTASTAFEICLHPFGTHCIQAMIVRAGGNTDLEAQLGRHLVGENPLPNNSTSLHVHPPHFYVDIMRIATICNGWTHRFSSVVCRVGAILSDFRGLEGHERIFLSMLNSNVENQHVIGQDGIGVGEGADRTEFLMFSGVTTAFIGISFRNVSSLPGSVTSASPSFRQQMIGSSVWGSNNHLSGSTVRDMNSGGSVLCSNTTFRWCSTSSEERPVSSHLHPSSLSSNDDLVKNKTFDVKLNHSRLNITTTTTFDNCTFQNMNYNPSVNRDGGSALILTTDSTSLTVHNCSFINCSVTVPDSYWAVSGGCILLKGLDFTFIRSSLFVSSCSFKDWYPGNEVNRDQFGGGVGISYTSASHSIVDSNFTLSGGKSRQENGGFVAIHNLRDTSSHVTISNCRLQGDGNSSGSSLNIRYCDFGSGGLSVSDTEIVNRASLFSLSSVSGAQPLVVTRSNLEDGSLVVEYNVVTPHDPLLFVDSTFDQFGIQSTKDSPNLCFLGTVFHTLPIPNSDRLLETRGPCFVIFQSCLFDCCDFHKDELMQCSYKTSLTLDTCTMNDCKLSRSGSTLFKLFESAFNAFSSTFCTVFGPYSNFLVFTTNGSVLLEDCRFELEQTTKADFEFIQAGRSFLNESSVINCTSTRSIGVTTDRNTITECPLFEVIRTPKAKDEIKLKVDADEDGNPVETNDKLRQAIQSLVPDSSTILSLSDGPFTENAILSIQTDVEIVGNGTETVHVTSDESPRPHTTQLTAELEVEAGASLTLRSITLIPSSSSCPLVSMNEEGNLSLKTIVVYAKQDRTKELFCLSAGTIRFFHSRFSFIAGSSALIIVSGNGSMFLKDTVFLSTSRTHPPTPPIDGSLQSGSCVEGRTSGSISIQFCKFGGCSSNGRAGAIDIVSTNTTSSLSMEGCQFDQNSAGTGLNEAERGDDVVLKKFSDDQLNLNFTTIESFSKLPFLVNDSHPHVPPPHTLHFAPNGLDMPLAWSSPNMLHESRLSDLTLQFLLGSRLHNNVHTAIITSLTYNDTMTPFSLKNASVSASLNSGCTITITQPSNEIFCCLLNASLLLSSLDLSVSELKNTAFSIDQASSISLNYVGITFTNKTLTHSFVDSAGRSTLFWRVTIPSGLTLNGVSFVQHIRSANDGNFTWKTTPVSSVSLTTQPFLHLEGMSTFQIEHDSYYQITNINSKCDGSFLFAKQSNVTLSTLKVSSCSAQRGGFAFFTSCNVTIRRSEFSSCSAQHGGVLFVELDEDNQLSSEYSSAFYSLIKSSRATATDENGVDVGRGGAICVKGTTTAKTPVNLVCVAFENNTAAFGNDVFVEESVLGEEGPDRLKGCGGESRSDWPHLEVEGITKEHNKDEWTRIATFIAYPEININPRFGSNDSQCRFSFSDCKTLEYAFRYLQLFYPNGTVYPRSVVVKENATFNSMSFEDENMKLRGGQNIKLNTTGPEGSSMFIILGDSRLTMQSFKFHHHGNHTFVSVMSSESWLEMVSCEVTIQSGTYSQSLVSSVGSGLSLSSFRFNKDYNSPLVTFTVPLISFHPTPSQVGGLGSAPFSITNSSFRNLTLLNSSIIVVETSGDVIFQNLNFTAVQKESERGIFLYLKGDNFKRQIIPENWDSSFQSDQHATHLGEDASLAENHKWRNGSIVYWLFSPSDVIVVNATDSSAVDHPNCGSAKFKCTTLDAALESASLNSLEVITLSSPSSLERVMTVEGTRTVRSSDTTQRKVAVALDSGISVKEGELTFHSIQFTSASSSAFSNGETVHTGSLFVVHSGSLSLNSCSLSSFTLASCPLISHTSGSLSLISCELRSIERVSGKGSILSTTMTSEMILTMDGVQLYSMPCSSESPAVLLNFSSITLPSPFPSFSLTNLRFEGFRLEPKDHYVEIVGRNISNFICEGDTRFSGSYSNDSNVDYLWSVDEDLNLSVSLLFYLLPQEGPVRVKRRGFDIDRCGYRNVWCSSVERAISRTTDRVLSEIVILGDSDLSLAVSLSNNVSLTKGEEQAILHASSDGSLMTTPHRSLLMEELSISLPQTQTAEAVIIVAPSGSATLNTIVVRSTGGSDATLVCVTGGRADITDLVMESEMKENTNLMEIIDGKVSVDTLRAENGIALNSSIVWMKAGIVSVSEMSIVGVSSISGCLIHASGTSARVKDIALSHISFSSAPFLFSSLESCSLSNVSITDFSSGALIEGTDVKSLDIESSRFSRPTKIKPEPNEEMSDICWWKDSHITLDNCSSAFHSVEMKHLPQGAVSIVGGELTLTSCTFIDNSPSNADFPSLCRNVLCSDGKVSIETIGGGDGLSSPHHWISTNDCSVEKEDKILPAPFFVPTLSSSKSTSKFDTTQEMYEIVLKGETLIPCGLSLEVFERLALSETEFSEGDHIFVELDPSEVKSWKEDTIELSLHQSSLAELNIKHDLHCRVLFGENGKTDSFSLTGLKGNMSQAGRVVSIVIPIVCSVILLLIFLIVVLVLVCRRQQKKKEEEKPKAMSELDECQIEVKDEEMDVNSTIRPLLNTSDVTLHPSSLNMISNGVDQGQQEVSSFRQQFIEHVDALKCEGEPAVIRVDAKKTLYSALHFEKALALPKTEIRRQLVVGLNRLVQHNPFSDVLTQLSSHWILVDSSGSVCLKLDRNFNETDLTAHQIANRKKMREEDCRWSAPEQIDEEDRGHNKDEKEPHAVPFDPLKASVFRLGLVLWELETGLVPFGELDAVNASRQVKGGQVPLISNWEDTSLASIVEECLSFDPNERPTLSDLQKHFSSSSTNPDPSPIQQQPIASITVIG